MNNIIKNSLVKFRCSHGLQTGYKNNDLDEEGENIIMGEDQSEIPGDSVNWCPFYITYRSTRSKREDPKGVDKFFLSQFYPYHNHELI